MKFEGKLRATIKGEQLNMHPKVRKEAERGRKKRRKGEKKRWREGGKEKEKITGEGDS